MLNEVIYQRHIVQGVVANGGYAIKMSNSFLVGIPDLLLKPKEWPAPQFWEVKVASYAWAEKSGIPRPVTIATTPLQRKTLREMRDAGMHTAVLVILPAPRRGVTLLLTRGVEQTHIPVEEIARCRYLRELNEPWGEAILNLNLKVPPPKWGTGTTKGSRPSTS